MAIKKEDYLQWRQSQVTREMAEGVAEAATQVVQALVTRSESNPAFDQYQRGYLRGVQAALEWEPDFILEEGELPDA